MILFCCDIHCFPKQSLAHLQSLDAFPGVFYALQEAIRNPRIKSYLESEDKDDSEFLSLREDIDKMCGFIAKFCFADAESTTLPSHVFDSDAG